MADVNIPNSVEKILMCNTDVLSLRLSILSNKELLEAFKSTFTMLNDYKPKDENERWQILDYSRMFIEQFKFRISAGTPASMLEFSTRIQDMMKVDKTIGDTYYTRNLLRLYAFCIKEMQDKQINPKQNFL